MYACTYSGTVLGVDGVVVGVEVDLANGLPQFDVVGLGGSAVKEARDRVRAALRNSGFDFPLQRITVNLAPADLRKEGSAFDLAIAVGVLLASEQLPHRSEQVCILGELTLDGTLRPIPGVLPILLEAKRRGITRAIVPDQNRKEAGLVDVEVLPAATLGEVVRWWKGEDDKGNAISLRAQMLAGGPAKNQETTVPDFADVIGQSSVKRGLEIAAAGFHNVLLIGPPGSGKTFLANCLPGIMPRLSHEEALEVTKIYSIAGHLTGTGGLIQDRPFRSPHHTITQAALVGGGPHAPRPGECSLAHGGILFLDELPEFSRHVLEVLRQPLESGTVTIGRARQVLTYPARFLLVGAMNPCPCGFYGTREQNECCCSPQQVQRYRSRLSGPLLDRIDIHLEVPRIPVEILDSRRGEEASAVILSRVEQARSRQVERFPHRKEFPFNSGMTPNDIRKYVVLDQEGQELLRMAFESMGLSARAYHRIVKVARTIADLAGSSEVRAEHVAEAIRYRAMERKVV